MTDGESDAERISRIEQMIEDHGDTWDLSDNDRDALTFLLNQLAAAQATITALSQMNARQQDTITEMQRHRDQWREYAYGNREKPSDYLDGNKVDRGETAREKAEAQITALSQENQQLRIALEKYGWHADCCPARRNDSSPSDEMCVCGFETLALRAEATKAEGASRPLRADKRDL